MRVFARVAATALGLTIAGCASGSGSNPTPPTPPAPTFAVTSPQDGSTVYGTPLTVSIHSQNVPDPAQLLVRLDGVNIASQLSAPDSNGVQSVQVSQPAVNFGKNQIQIRYQTTQVNTSFTLNTPAGAGSAPSQGAVDLSTQLVGITTRVLAPGQTGTLATQWGVELTTTSGNTYYWSNVPINQNSAQCGDCSFGFQIVLLNRADLLTRSP
jgi:hypothetical protein